MNILNGPEYCYHSLISYHDEIPRAPRTAEASAFFQQVEFWSNLAVTQRLRGFEGENRRFCLQVSFKWIGLVTEVTNYDI